jgi:hypothetical protein
MLWPSMEPFCAIAEMLQQPKIAESRSRWRRAKDFISGLCGKALDLKHAPAFRSLWRDSHRNVYRKCARRLEENPSSFVYNLSRHLYIQTEEGLAERYLASKTHVRLVNIPSVPSMPEHNSSSWSNRVHAKCLQTGRYLCLQRTHWLTSRPSPALCSSCVVMYCMRTKVVARSPCAASGLHRSQHIGIRILLL